MIIVLRKKTQLFSISRSFHIVLRNLTRNQYVLPVNNWFKIFPVLWLQWIDFFFQSKIDWGSITGYHTLAYNLERFNNPILHLWREFKRLYLNQLCRRPRRSVLLRSNGFALCVLWRKKASVSIDHLCTLFYIFRRLFNFSSFLVGLQQKMGISLSLHI